MVDFDSNAQVLRELDIAVVAASVDSVERTQQLAEGLRIRYVRMLAQVDAMGISEATGAFYQTGDRTFLHATGFLLDPSGTVVNAVYSTGPIGRFAANDVLKKVVFERAKAAG